MKVWVCTVCGWIYDEAKGDPDYDLAPGVRHAQGEGDRVVSLPFFASFPYAARLSAIHDRLESHVMNKLC